MPRTDVKPADVAWAVSFATVVVERLVCVPFPLGSHPLPDGAPEVDPTPGNPTCARIPWPKAHRPDASSTQPKTERKSRSGFIEAFLSVGSASEPAPSPERALCARRRRRTSAPIPRTTEVKLPVIPPVWEPYLYLGGLVLLLGAAAIVIVILLEPKGLPHSPSAAPSTRSNAGTHDRLGKSARE